MPSSSALLIRAPDAEKPDRYESAFAEAGFAAASVAALDTGFVNDDSLDAAIRERASEFDGVIVTSSRACEAWKRSVQRLYPSQEHSPTNENGWATTPFYAVGRATAVALRTIADSPAAPRDIRGEESGTGEQLARFIVEDIRKDDAERGHPARLLYLTGDKNRDTVPSILTEAGISFEPLQVYGTCGAPDFEQRLDEALADLPSDTTEQWVVFFAPSSTDFALPYLHERFELRREVASLSGTQKAARIAAIGPMSSEHISRERHLHVDAVASKPSPAQLVEAIRTAAAMSP
ncbi:tetrapyrrole biosynthesis, uroporphyrinogen III synthase [Schizophyllum commune H4-8]|uniref:tetrapyrrole biosynthesis, uroporphyrinogen III synthase n=1 Tax=Schizophyllum commune (strain H4-8 / FGSC 9210) TaxID=578458 RepID=UPI002160D28B|nr:tetrapyrrole biosynthesis, uroporphyrinogen III synthase [Schizophyllum commune H4-8]KAI5897604.1 tetrapyrrole biosynthesis, uroporphyrinogen III synthase [Schizophyllum commune H4-8]